MISFLILAAVLCIASSMAGRLSPDWKTRTTFFGWVIGLAVYGAFIGRLISDPKSRLMMVKIFGARPLGIDSMVLGCLVFGAVMAPFVYILRHLTPVIWATKMPPEYEDLFSKREKIWSCSISILGVVYFVAVLAIWICYAPSWRD
jgi:hypothetical protein